MDISVEEIIKLAVAAGRMAAERTPVAAFKATERRLYALPILREKLKRDRERVAELTAAARADLEAAIAAYAAEVETLDQALAACAGDPYYQSVNRRRLIQRVAIRLHGVEVIK